MPSRTHSIFKTLLEPIFVLWLLTPIELLCLFYPVLLFSTLKTYVDVKSFMNKVGLDWIMASRNSPKCVLTRMASLETLSASRTRENSVLALSPVKVCWFWSGHRSRAAEESLTFNPGVGSSGPGGLLVTWLPSD